MVQQYLLLPVVVLLVRLLLLLAREPSQHQPLHLQEVRWQQPSRQPTHKAQPSATSPRTRGMPCSRRSRRSRRSSRRCCRRSRRCRCWV
jgi:hypothetical protein